MKGDALLLSRVIAGGRVQFIIPVYQRNYSWLTENCNQLFNDLVDLALLQVVQKPIKLV